ncbi:hypothetical protein WS62_15195 [Burkholderia sp. ABCPW 14]|nr:hypothetical protein WS62_15195 [Burkholderia sp. ABCPW 14]
MRERGRGRVASLGVALLGVALLGVALLGVALLGVALLGVALLGVALLGVALLGVAFARCATRDTRRVHTCAIALLQLDSHEQRTESRRSIHAVETRLG